MSIDFTGVKAITVPEGAVKKITRKSDGVVLWETISKTPIGEMPVGSIVKLNVDRSPENFIIVNQGRPSTKYDSSCDGTWLLMENVHTRRKFDSTNHDYANSDVISYLTNVFYKLFDSDIKNVIKTIKLPYRKGAGTSTTVTSGSKGLSTNIFLLSYTELGYSKNSNAPVEGAVLKYFNGVLNATRVGRLKTGGVAVRWWLRTPSIEGNTYVWTVNSAGSKETDTVTNSDGGVRPALVLPSNTVYVDNNNNVIV